MSGNSLFGGLVGLLVGFAAALVFCWFTWVRPLQANLDAREKSLQEWERINRLEREAVGTIKTISVEELRRWVATVDEQNTRFAELQRIAHEQEMQLAGPAHTYIVITATFVLGVVALVVFWLRDGNTSAATTLDAIAGLAPEQIIRTAVMARLVQPQVAPGPVVGSAAVSYPLGNTPQIRVEGTRAEPRPNGAGGDVTA
jgi:hypothetical protein